MLSLANVTMISFKTILTASRMRMVAIRSDTKFSDPFIMLTATHLIFGVTIKIIIKNSEKLVSKLV
jgi:hypothetical protein